MNLMTWSACAVAESSALISCSPEDVLSASFLAVLVHRLSRGMRPDYRGKEWKDHGGIDPTPGEQDRKAQDKISRLIDTDGDGVMDKKEVFYEGLDLVTGLVFHKDGVIVTQAPDILWLRDTNGDAG